ncbi:MAG: NAD-dependent dehydratase [Cytophagales bacterium CG18_big_fil_WC_8_21_14_2_50_42_9]|nr:MAG: NAD-dependent dehydratase [Cytophagales bacterium CG18_big_fil_WC_8_21_14_2_50_42_9]
MQQQEKTALVVGGNGIIGRNLTTYLTSTNNWHNVIVTSQSPLAFETTATYVSMNLLDEQAVSQQAEALKEVTHVFFTAYMERKILSEQTSYNLALLKNLIDGVEAVAPNLEHVTFIQGGKAYGAHLGLYKTPAKETDLRHMPPNFYYSQEDYLREKSAGKKWSWTALRPDIVMGFAIGNPMNLSNLIAVYASLCKELKVAFRYPGTPKAYQVLVNVTGVDVLSQSMEWAATNDQCKNEIFNITNGDIFRWSQAWPKIAAFFDVEYAEPQTFSLTEYMADKKPLWDEMIRKYNLQNNSIEKLVQWPFGDFIFNTEYDAFFDVNKARRFGFHEMHIDSIEQMLQTFQSLKDARIIP